MTREAWQATDEPCWNSGCRLFNVDWPERGTAASTSCLRHAFGASRWRLWDAAFPRGCTWARSLGTRFTCFAASGCLPGRPPRVPFPRLLGHLALSLSLSLPSLPNTLSFFCSTKHRTPFVATANSTPRASFVFLLSSRPIYLRAFQLSLSDSFIVGLLDQTVPSGPPRAAKVVCAF